MDKDAYIKQLESELDLAKSKYNTIYESVRSVDRAVNNFKRRHKKTYDFIRDSYKKIQSRRSIPELAGSVTHTKNEKAPLALIYSNHNVKRLNLVLDRLDEKTLKDAEVSESVIGATKMAVKGKYLLRIISRNNLVDPKLYLDFLAKKKLSAPEQYSFYTDIDTRVSSPIRRLEISSGDIFYEK